jgi:hypothetical protein
MSESDFDLTELGEEPSGRRARREREAPAGVSPWQVIWWLCGVAFVAFYLYTQVQILSLRNRPPAPEPPPATIGGR